ncbi:hypothetical protein GYMLUDRAFT_88460 [Collybiopsis luxurians FD-317 M1]|uniref:Protein kinase domain-containing protein n=1 Tax=Collybiopsis luxurians FD-317 M1 TaxID=944289 RepID=A0A0D0C622_9AGAR|nr:hypothetical protein GYMLUDRAFT_88460 [Collybiopsis luxurians FD-317 M1]
MRITITESVEPLLELKSPREFAQVFYDILQIHQWLYEHAGILYRDLSIGNIMCRRIGNRVYGVLNDFDVSSYVRDLGLESSKDRRGTRPFMAYDLLSKEWTGEHMYRHDLESLFCIMLIVCCNYRRPNRRADRRPYSNWFLGVDAEVRWRKKTFLLSTGDISTNIQNYFLGFEQWLTTLSSWLRSGYKESLALQEREEREEEEGEVKPFDFATLGGRITYKEMNDLMCSFQDQPLETRPTGGNPNN